ncbi:hypothetical protein [Methylomicrobium sp. Wu6]|nr:hypothetical protein [Methylomicrobium sp. Wu6]MEC4749424.1 hypothetical protein [Methylomicrobium sp. Wu6]
MKSAEFKELLIAIGKLDHHQRKPLSTMAIPFGDFLLKRKRLAPEGG